MEKYTRDQLVEAQKEYFRRYRTNPEDFEDPVTPENWTDEKAEDSIDYLLNLVKK